MTIDPEEITTHTAKIIRALYKKSEPGLTLVIQRESDSLEGILHFTHEPPEFDEIPSQKDSPSPIAQLYGDFQVKDSSELVGKEVRGLYFLKNSIVAIEKP